MPSRRPRLSPDLAHRFLQALDFSSRTDVQHWFQTYDESGKDRDILQCSLHGTFSEHARALIELNNSGAGVHVVVNATDDLGKAEENIVAPRACFVDFDGTEPDIGAFPVSPSIVVRSAHGPHVYWLLQPGQSLVDWRHIQILLAEDHGGDLKIAKLPRLQRLPGFLHQKSTPFFVGVEAFADPLTRYDLDELVRAWGFQDRLEKAREQEAERERRARERRSAPAQQQRSNGLSSVERARRYIDKVEGAPEGERNEHTSKHVASAGYDFGVDCETWIDEVLAWNDTHNKPPLSHREIVALVRSTYRYLQRRSADPPGWKLNEDSDEWKMRKRRNVDGRIDDDEAIWQAVVNGEPAGGAQAAAPANEGTYEAFERQQIVDLQLSLENGVQVLLDQDLLSWPCDATPPSLDGFPLTVRGNAMRVLAAHRPTLRHCIPTAQWYAWDGKRWKKDEGSHVMSLINRRLASMHGMLLSKDVQVLKDDSDEVRAKKLGLRENIWKHITRSERASSVKEVAELVGWQPTIKVFPDQLDGHDDLINTQSGVVNTVALKQRPHDPAQYHTMVTRAPFDGKSECPGWMAFLDWAMRGDKEMIEFLQRAVGYTATGHMREQVFFLCYGNGGNGKSTFLETVIHVLGDYATSADIELFLMSPTQRVGSANEELLALRGVRMVYAFEPNEGRALMESRIKQITGGERINARPLYGRPIHFYPKFSLWLSTNHRPVIRGTDDGIWRRVLLIPWRAKIGEDQKDDSLGRKLLSEAPGIMRWILEGAWKWQHERLGIPAEVRDQTLAYRDEMDLIGAFLEQCCKVDDLDAKETSSSLYEVFKAWCETQGERAWKQKTLKERLRERGITCTKNRGVMTYRGVKLLESTAALLAPQYGRTTLFDGPPD